MPSSLPYLGQLIEAAHLFTVSGSSPAYDHMVQMAALIHFHGHVFASAPCRSRQDSETFCLSEGEARCQLWLIPNTCNPVHPCVPKSQEPALSSLLRNFTYPSQPTLPESMVDLSRAQSHWRTHEDAAPPSPGPEASHYVSFCCTTGLTAKGTCVLTEFIITALTASPQGCWGLQEAMGSA